MIPPVSSASTSTATIWPAGSNSRVRAAAESRTWRSVSHRPPAQIGRLMKKIARQPSESISRPPSVGPAALIAPPVALHHATARTRAAASFAQAWVMSASDVGRIIAAPTPCATRAAISAASDGASAQPSDASRNSARPYANSRRLPKRSASVPDVSSSAANDSVYASTIHCSPWTLDPNEWPRLGIATLTTVTSSWTIAKPRLAAATVGKIARSDVRYGLAPAGSERSSAGARSLIVSSASRGGGGGTQPAARRLRANCAADGIGSSNGFPWGGGRAPAADRRPAHRRIRQKTSIDPLANTNNMPRLFNNYSC